MPLYQHVMVGRRLFDLFAPTTPRRTPGGPKVNPELIGSPATTGAPADSDRRGKRNAPRSRAGARGQGNAARPRAGSQPRRRGRAAGREGLLPAIVFIFSRVGCDAAVTAVPEREPAADHARRARRDRRVRRGALPQPPRRGPARARLPRLPRGALPRRRGPPRRDAADVQGRASRSCSSAAWCKVVFATETLALGINMPARSVVIEKLSKWNGETHADITPGEYTQLTGRAGRRGIDVEGHGVVLWQQGFDPKAVAGLASTRTYPLKSSFRPSYNMAVNLVHQVGREHRARAAGVVVRAVPGGQGGRRAGPAAAQGGGRAGRVRRRRHLPPRRLHGVRRAAPAALRHREAAQARHRRADKRDAGHRVPGGAAARRRDRGAGREVLRDGGRDRPGHHARTGRGRGPTC